MQELEKNMDDLFRKAAENYPLKTGESDWDKIAPVLLNGPAIPPALPPGKKNIRRLTGLSGVLLLGLFLGTLLMPHLSGNRTVSQRPFPASGKAVPGASGTAAPMKGSADFRERNPLYPAVTPVDISAKGLARPLSVRRAAAGITSTPPKTTGKIIRDPEPSNPAAGSAAGTLRGISGDRLLPNRTIPAGTGLQKPLSDTLQKKKDSPRGLYVGGIAGLSFNEVKSQALRKPGYDAGLLLGYRFNRHFAIETGLLYARKYYFSDGKYFSMDKTAASMPAGMKILSLEGSSTLFEVPLVFNYHLWHRDKNQVFASAGISSYIMTGEKNNYQASMNGAQESLTGVYKDVSRYFAVMADISAGYEYRLGQHARIRFEPYLKIPLKGIGVGSMPVMSAGLHIGILSFIR